MIRPVTIEIEIHRYDERWFLRINGEAIHVESYVEVMAAIRRKAWEIFDENRAQE